MALRIITVISIFTIAKVQCSQKKGIAHWADNYSCNDFKALNVSWWYDWRMDLNYFHKHNICSSSIDSYKNTHVPMVWSYHSNTKINIANEAQFILGFNEPNHRNQANLTPQQAAVAWPDMERNSKGKPLVSPSAAPCGANCNHGDTVNWFNEFFKHCNNCRIDYLATHAYFCNADRTMHFLENLYHKYGRKIWLTEFACANTADPVKTLNYMKHILPRLEAADYVFRYSWYMARITGSNPFVNSAASLLEPHTSTLTALGQYYNNFQGYSPAVVG